MSTVHENRSDSVAPPEPAGAPLRKWPIPLALGLVALALRALRWAQTPAMFNDGPVFIEIARAMRAGDWTTALEYDQHPLYSLLTVLVHGVASDWETAGAAVSIAAGAAAVLFLYAWLRDAFDRQVAWIGALLLAVHPYAVAFSADVQSEGLYLAAFLGALALLWRALDRRSSAYALGAGLACGLAYLVRPEGAGVVLIGLALVLVEWGRRRWPLRSAGRWAVALGLGTALAMAPYVALLSVRHGTLTFSQKKSIESFIGIDSFRNWIRFDGPEIQGGGPGVPPDVASVVPTPNGSAGPSDPSALSELVQNTLSSARYESALLILLGLWALRGPLGLRGRFVLLAFVLYSLILYALITEAGYLSRRHTLALSVLAFGYAATGVPILGGAILRAARSILRSRRPVRAREAVAAGLVVVLGLGLAKGMRPHRQNAVAERRAAEWLREQGTSGAVAAGKRRVAFYADAPFVNPWRAPGDAPLLTYLQRRSVRYLIVDEDENRVLLERTSGEPSGLVLLHEEEANGHATFVYELVPPGPSQILE